MENKENKKCGLRYCGATIADYNKIIQGKKCRCMTCLGKDSVDCDILKQSEKMNADLQKLMCMKCEYYSGR